MGRKKGAEGVNICFDCKNACGGCPWTEYDDVERCVKFNKVDGWTADKIVRPVIGETYHITACPLFERG